MPELPEVETVRQVLKEDLEGRTITNIDLRYQNIFENPSELNKLINNKFIDIDRKGKYLIFILERGYMLSHLRMEGKYFYVLNDYELNKHMHVIFYLDNGHKLIYQDVRKFGRMHYYDTLEELKNDLNIGIDANMSLPYLDSLYLKLKNNKKDLKTLLLDQTFIAGLGNIYVDEVLYKAKLNPLTKACDIFKEELNNILVASKEVLDKAILNKGTTIRSYTSSLGVEGNYQDYLAIHTKDNCPKGHNVVKLKIGGRGTYVCPICQVNKSYVIGITGGIACGKSNIVNILKSYNYPVLDSDSIVNEAYQDEEILSKIKASFGTTNRQELGLIVYNDKNKKSSLEAIIHPYVKDKIIKGINNNNLVFIDVPLLFEAKFDSLCNKIICCYTDSQTQLQRLIERDKIDINYAKVKIASQLDLEYKKEHSNYLIDTSGTFKETEKKLEEILKEIMYGIY